MLQDPLSWQKLRAWSFPSSRKRCKTMDDKKNRCLVLAALADRTRQNQQSGIYGGRQEPGSGGNFPEEEAPGRPLSSSSASDHQLRLPSINWTRASLQSFPPAPSPASATSSTRHRFDLQIADTDGSGFPPPPPLVHRPQAPRSSPSRNFPTAVVHQTLTNCLPSQTPSSFSFPTTRGSDGHHAVWQRNGGRDEASPACHQVTVAC